MRTVKRAVLFDLDGTLTHSLPDLAVAVNHVLAQDERSALTEAEISPMVGDGVRTLLERAYDARGGSPKGGIADALARFMDYYEAHSAVLTRPFPHVVETLEQLKAKGIAMAVCTNKPRAATHEILNTLDLTRFFPVVIGGDDTPAMKPDPLHLTTALDRLRVTRDEAVMVGDSINDVLAAKGAGIPCIAVSFGYSRVPAADLGANLVIDDFSAIIDAVIGRD